jgi:hypothetical protein
MMVLPMNAVDDDFEGSRKYSVSINGDGTQSFQDETEYRQQGTNFGALEYNQLCAAIQGFTSATTQYSDDMQEVTETDANGRQRVTVFGRGEHGNRQITETLKDVGGTVLGSKITTFSNGNRVISEEVQL